MMRHAPVGSGASSPAVFSQDDGDTRPLTETDFYFGDAPGGRLNVAKKGGLIKKVPRGLIPIVYYASHAVMFVSILVGNRVVPPEQVLTHPVGRGMVALLAVTMVLYGYLFYSNPGRIRSKREHRRGDPGVDGVFIEEDPSKPTCKICCTTQPLRARHCPLCDRCIYTYDHHCWWLDSCVGGRNKPEYLVFLYLEFSLIFGSLAITAMSLRPPFSVQNYILLPSVLVVTGVTLYWSGNLALFHTRLVLRNQTAYEFFRPKYCSYIEQVYPAPECCQRKAYLFSRGLCKNLMTFLFKRPAEWELVKDKIPAAQTRCQKKCHMLPMAND